MDESLEHQVQTLSINMLGEQDGGYRPQIKLPSQQMTCSHQWQYNSQVENPTCVCCKKETITRARISCPQCLVVACNLCGPYYFQKAVPVEPAPYTTEQPSSFHKLILQQSEYIVWCDAEITRLKKEIQYLWDQLLLNHLILSNDLEELTLADKCKEQKGKDILHTKTNCFIIQAETAHAAAGGGGTIIRNRLYNLAAQIEIPGVKTFSVRAILDTGATTCCIDENSVPKEALEDNTFTVQFTGVFLEYGKEIIMFVDPLVEVLKMVDGEGAIMEYLYEALDRAKEAVKRWHRNLHNPIHVASAFLNLHLFWNKTVKMDEAVHEGLDIVVKNLFLVKIIMK
ncbi:hypothetical protein EJ110_NYTH18675 [Nymphaea thermarum]|nr:hypothetical protein EJ110_NYTH18675 [Nymphaea thermarum]